MLAYNSINGVNIAVVGCCHGELDAIYSSLSHPDCVPVDLLLVCGDFQCVRDMIDLNCVAMPQKYRKLNTFHHYVNGDKLAPVLTIFIGGNHEASNILQSLYYGGYVAPRIYFLGFAGVVTYKGIRISGISGIFNERHYRLGHYEKPPYTEDTMRSVYHMRELEIYRLTHLLKSGITNESNDKAVDIFLSHDWPDGVWNYGNAQQLLRAKPYFRDDMASGKLGNPPLMHILRMLKPSFWFSAHLHVKFPAVVPHYDNENLNASVANTTNDYDANARGAGTGGSTRPGCRVTRFLALDKVLPRRDFMQILFVPYDEDSHARDPTVGERNPTSNNSRASYCDQGEQLRFDAEWLSIVKKTHGLLKTVRSAVTMPSEIEPVGPAELAEVRSLLQKEYGPELIIPPLAPLKDGVPSAGVDDDTSKISSNNSTSSTSSSSVMADAPTEEEFLAFTPQNNLFDPAAIEHRKAAARRVTQKARAQHTIQNTQLGNAQTDRLLQALKLPHVWTCPAAAGTDRGVVDAASSSSSSPSSSSSRPPPPPGPPPLSLPSGAGVGVGMGVGVGVFASAPMEVGSGFNRSEVHSNRGIHSAGIGRGRSATQPAWMSGNGSSFSSSVSNSVSSGVGDSSSSNGCIGIGLGTSLSNHGPPPSVERYGGYYPSVPLNPNPVPTSLPPPATTATTATTATSAPVIGLPGPTPSLPVTATISHIARSTLVLPAANANASADDVAVNENGDILW